MEIEAANLMDLGALRHLENVCFGNDAWPLLDLIAVLTWPDVIRLKATESGEMIGFIAGDPRQSNGAVWIATIAVDPRFRRRGIGSALMLECERRVSMPVIKLTARISNQGAIRMYESLGYRTSDIWRAYYSDGEDGLVMSKTL
ncbi:MAG TPA: GNAT family N-acetyltransferase [Anaerolineales bacterium]|nr:GNAT family N-acetyltransferase [Anaerolineales bacterium]